MLRNDQEMLACYRDSIDPDQLLDALGPQILVLARRLARNEAVSVEHIASRMDGAARMLSDLMPSFYPTSTQPHPPWTASDDAALSALIAEENPDGQ